MIVFNREDFGRSALVVYLMSIGWFAGLLVGWQLEVFILFLQHNDSLSIALKPPIPTFT